jgi:hypothetical protein
LIVFGGAKEGGQPSYIAPIGVWNPVDFQKEANTGFQGNILDKFP